MPHSLHAARRFLKVNTDSASNTRGGNEFQCNTILLWQLSFSSSSVNMRRWTCVRYCRSAMTQKLFSSGPGTFRRTERKEDIDGLDRISCDSLFHSEMVLRNTSILTAINTRRKCKVYPEVNVWIIRSLQLISLLSAVLFPDVQYDMLIR